MMPASADNFVWRSNLPDMKTGDCSLEHNNFSAAGDAGGQQSADLKSDNCGIANG